MKNLNVTFLFVVLLLSIFPSSAHADDRVQPRWWSVQSIDTMKYSRDIAREKLYDSSYDAVIDWHVASIAQTGATHVVVATPYDKEFIPYLSKWVSAARKHNINVWFRGNFSGWEEWFGYDEITKEEHIAKTREFIIQNPDLFQDGDLFSSCPECENGALGDPRLTGKVDEYRKFLVDEYDVTKSAFASMGKNVGANLFSMNGDVAKLIMDKETTQSLDGIIVVDHYVESPEKLNDDITMYAQISGGNVVLGEFGAPIPDIHGPMTEEQQKEWLQTTLELLSQNPHVIGVNYWTNLGGTTALWNSDKTPRKAVSTLTSFYTPKSISGIVTNELGIPLSNVGITLGNKTTMTDRSGNFSIEYLFNGEQIHITKEAYKDVSVKIYDNEEKLTITLQKSEESFFFRLVKRIYQFFT
jgi:hypothetical protein